MRNILALVLAVLLVCSFCGCAAAYAQDPGVNLTAEGAESIALTHAGLTADQVTRLRTEYEIEDGVPVWEVRFRHDRWEYDYEIDAQTGAILSQDRDD